MTKQTPTIIYCCKGWEHLCYAVWSIRTLKQFHYEPIEVIVSNEKEKSFFLEKHPDLSCTVLNAEIGSYPAFSYKPFILNRYLNEYGIQHKNRDVVICDADILWKEDPAALFQRFHHQAWVHKITAINPKDYLLPVESVSEGNIGLITVLHYVKRHGLDVYPVYRPNAGLFMLGEEVFPKMLESWLQKIHSLPPHEMKMSEALMALTYAEMGITPVSDQEDIKHYGCEQQEVEFSIAPFEATQPGEGEYTGYQTAKHYFGDQRPLMLQHAQERGLDSDGLIHIIQKERAKKQRQVWLSMPKRKLSRLKQKLFAS